MRSNLTLPAAIVLSGVIVGAALVYDARARFAAGPRDESGSVRANANISALEAAVTPARGALLPLVWGDLGAKLVSVGAIDADKLKAVYAARGKFTNEFAALLEGRSDGKLTITRENAGFLLNLFWALGLANKNEILDAGEMMDPAYGGAGGFASTGGWTVSVGDPMDHYSRHRFFTLSTEQQELVDRVSRGIYRPCCGNAAHFPDCNHGMAMLGLLELAASQGVGEEEMWRLALTANSYWFPDTYLTIATYMKERGVSWGAVNPQAMLGSEYSSAEGYRSIASRLIRPAERGGGSSGCGVEAGGAPIAPPRQEGGCGV